MSMSEQASKPGERLPADIREAAGASFLRRKAPVLSFCAVLLAGLIALTMQTFRMLDHFIQDAFNKKL